MDSIRRAGPRLARGFRVARLLCVPTTTTAPVCCSVSPKKTGAPCHLASDVSGVSAHGTAARLVSRRDQTDRDSVAHEVRGDPLMRGDMRGMANDAIVRIGSTWTTCRLFKVAAASDWVVAGDGGGRSSSLRRASGRSLLWPEG